MIRIKSLYLFLFEAGTDKPEPGEIEGYFHYCNDDLETHARAEDFRKGPAKGQAFIKVEHYPRGYQLATRFLPGSIEVEEREQGNHRESHGRPQGATLLYTVSVAHTSVV